MRADIFAVSVFFFKASTYLVYREKKTDGMLVAVEEAKLMVASSNMACNEELLLKWLIYNSMILSGF